MMMLYTLPDVKGPQGISKGTFKHGEFADVDPFLCLVYFKAIKIKYFHFFNNFFMKTIKIRMYICKFELEDV